MYEGHPGEIDSVGSSDSARVELARVRGGGGGGGQEGESRHEFTNNNFAFHDLRNQFLPFYDF